MLKGPVGLQLLEVTQADKQVAFRRVVVARQQLLLDLCWVAGDVLKRGSPHLALAIQVAMRLEAVMELSPDDGESRVADRRRTWSAELGPPDGALGAHDRAMVLDGRWVAFGAPFQQEMDRLTVSRDPPCPFSAAGISRLPSVDRAETARGRPPADAITAPGRWPGPRWAQRPSLIQAAAGPEGWMRRRSWR